MKIVKVNYRIKRSNFGSPLEIKVDMRDLERDGLGYYLEVNGIINQGDEFEVLNRFFDFIPEKKDQDKNLRNNKQSSNFKRPFIKSDENVEILEWRVDLYSVPFFLDQSNLYPRYVDVKAKTIGKAILIAMNKVGLFGTFPEGWKNISVIAGDNISDFGMYELGNENNPFIQQFKKGKESHFA